MSFTSTRQANFFLTDDTRAGSPLTARYMLRKEHDYPAIDDELRRDVRRATYDAGTGTLEIPPDYVLLMIGHTSELTAAVEAAARRGLTMITTSDGSPLTCYFVRISVSAIQTDSLLAIASQTYWNQTDWNDYATDWLIPASAQGTNYNYVSTLDEAQATRGTSLLGFIRECKAQANKIDT